MSERTTMLGHTDAPHSNGRNFLAGVLAGALGVFALGAVFLHSTSVVTTPIALETQNLAASPALSSLPGVSAADLALLDAPLDPASGLTQEEWTSARVARWIVHANTWATIATTSVHLKGAPFTSLISYSDGNGMNPGNATGHLFFYSSKVGSTGKDLAASSQASVSISMAQLNHCELDPQDPTCWRVIFSGNVIPVDGDDKTKALTALYSKHPQMRDWPDNHSFSAYEMHPTEILLLDFYGPAKHVSPAAYYSVRF
ncbi:hypothetical protein ACHHYP_16253 [Achlya hypogyna]|uniref:CREG-like beta-barrel domain-containing protein n=1 Tax=Achlya hypogyna TaxID=1202772 RepID=A0A1V9Y9E3_ACHHY|nr:hypothetical protein ACHHYP_16253 [Achlya hypogyna]